MKSIRILLRLKPFIKPYLPHLIGSLLLSIPLSIIRFAPAPFVKHFTDSVLVQKDSKYVYLIPLAIIGVFLLNFVVRFFHYYLSRYVTEKVTVLMRNSIYAHYNYLSMDYFTKNKMGELTSRIIFDVTYLNQGVRVFSDLIREPITFIALLSYAIYVHWKLTLITLVVTPLFVLLFSNTGRHIKRLSTRVQEKQGEVTSVVQESLIGIRNIKVFGLERFSTNKFKLKNQEFLRAALKTIRVEELAHPGVELVVSISLALVFYYGGKEILNGNLTPGGLLGFFTAFGLMLNPLRAINDINIKLNQATAALTRIFDVLDTQPRVQESLSPVDYVGLKNEIEFKNVTFAYDDKNVLENVSFKIKKGEKIAFVGPSGSGKTTLVNLLPRLYDVTKGSIEIDGVDIRHFPVREYRKSIAMVTQEVFLFNDTIENNIKCGRFSAKTNEIEEAARKASAYDFIMASPNGFQSTTGDLGNRLSGGERQRISIARAFLRNADILILDEATSNLDRESERVVQEALNDLMKDKTTFIIAHRLSAIKNVDRIIVLEDGKLIEVGSHDELLAKKGLYSDLFGTM